MRVYRVVACPRCGHVQITSARKAYRCFRCRATVELKESSILYETPDAFQARRKLLEIKGEGAPSFRKPGTSSV